MRFLDSRANSAALDSAAERQTVYQVFHRVREAFGVSVLGTSTDVVDGTVVVAAALAAWDYHVTITNRPARRVSLEPRDWLIDHFDPLPVREQPSEVVSAWKALPPLVTAPAMQARFHHLLHQRGGPSTRAHAEAAADAYVQAASVWTREMDSIEDFATSLRLSRAFRDDGRTDVAVGGLLDITERELGNDEPRFGIVYRSLDAVAGEPRTFDRFDILLAVAEAAFDSGLDKNRILALTLARANSAVEREQIWERRVRAATPNARTTRCSVASACWMRFVWRRRPGYIG